MGEEEYREGLHGGTLEEREILAWASLEAKLVLVSKAIEW